MAQEVKQAVAQQAPVVLPPPGLADANGDLPRHLRTEAVLGSLGRDEDGTTLAPKGREVLTKAGVDPNTHGLLTCSNRPGSSVFLEFHTAKDLRVAQSKIRQLQHKFPTATSPVWLAS